MGINRKKEQLIPIKQARAHFPSRPSRQTLWNWRTKGYRGSRLEYVSLMGKVFTSVEAIDRFLDKVQRKGSRR